MEEGTHRGSRRLLLEGTKIAGQAVGKGRKPQDCEEEENGPSSLGFLPSPSSYPYLPRGAGLT